MRLVALFFVLLLFILSGCDKADESAVFAASYKGTFNRTDGAPLGDGVASNVTLNFTANTFSGSGDLRNHPAICSGTFTISQSKLIVNNSCYFTADFDWTLIFKGEYNYVQNGKQLRIWRTYANGLQDVYELAKVD